MGGSGAVSPPRSPSTFTLLTPELTHAVLSKPDEVTAWRENAGGPTAYTSGRCWDRTSDPRLVSRTKSDDAEDD